MLKFIEKNLGIILQVTILLLGLIVGYALLSHQVTANTEDIKQEIAWRREHLECHQEIVVRLAEIQKDLDYLIKNGL